MSKNHNPQLSGLRSPLLSSSEMELTVRVQRLEKQLAYLGHCLQAQQGALGVVGRKLHLQLRPSSEWTPGRLYRLHVVVAAHMDEMDFRGADLRGINLPASDALQLVGARFDDANLQDAHLVGVNLQDACLDRANLRGAWLQDVNLSGASIKDADCTGAYFQTVALADATLDRAILTSARLRHLVLDGTSFERAQMAGCELHHTQIRSSNLDLLQGTKKMLEVHKHHNLAVFSVARPFESSYLQCSYDKYKMRHVTHRKT